MVSLVIISSGKAELISTVKVMGHIWKWKRARVGACREGGGLALAKGIAMITSLWEGGLALHIHWLQSGPWPSQTRSLKGSYSIYRVTFTKQLIKNWGPSRTHWGWSNGVAFACGYWLDRDYYH